MILISDDDERDERDEVDEIEGTLDQADIPRIPEGDEFVTPYRGSLGIRRPDRKRKRHEEVMAELQDLRHRQIQTERLVVDLTNEILDLKRLLQEWMVQENQ